MKLVVGTTGLLGSGAEIVHGDLKAPASLTAACQGVSAVVSTASSTLSRPPVDSIDTVDRQGQLDPLSPLDVVQLAERITGQPFAVQHVPERDLQAQYAAASDPMAKSFAGLLLYYAAGDVIDMSGPLRLFQFPPLRSVYEHLQSSVLQAGQSV